MLMRDVCGSYRSCIEMVKMPYTIILMMAGVQTTVSCVNNCMKTMIVFRCSVADEFKNCIDNVRCTQTQTQNDTGYQLHLLAVGFTNWDTYACDNSSGTLEGYTHTRFQVLT